MIIEIILVLLSVFLMGMLVGMKIESDMIFRKQFKKDNNKK